MADIVIRSEKDAFMDEHTQNWATEMYAAAAGQKAVKVKTLTPIKTLRDFTDMELIMELLDRGYVLGKHIEEVKA